MFYLDDEIGLKCYHYQKAPGIGDVCKNKSCGEVVKCQANYPSKKNYGDSCSILVWKGKYFKLFIVKKMCSVGRKSLIIIFVLFCIYNKIMKTDQITHGK